MAWNPEQYRKFAAERSQPFWDLAALVERDAPIERAVDLGCGPGELTAALVEQLDTGGLELVGIDSSAAMLAAAAQHASDRLTFVEGDIGMWTSNGDHHLVFANASLQWVPDHRAVLTRWAAALTDGGQLAVQVPYNATHPSHRLADEVARSEPFLSAMGHDVPPDQVAVNVLRPDEYAVLLDDLGFERQHVRQQVYGHRLESTAAVVEWVRGTTLTRFFARLPDELHERFVSAYRERLLAELGEYSPYFYPFNRILFWARLS